MSAVLDLYKQVLNKGLDNNSSNYSQRDESLFKASIYLIKCIDKQHGFLENSFEEKVELEPYLSIYSNDKHIGFHESIFYTYSCFVYDFLVEGVANEFESSTFVSLTELQNMSATCPNLDTLTRFLTDLDELPLDKINFNEYQNEFKTLI